MSKMAQILDYLMKNKKVAIAAVVVLVILVLFLTGGEKTQDKKGSNTAQSNSKGVISKEEGTAGEVRALQQEMEKMKKEREEEKKAQEIKKLNETVQTLPSFKPLSDASGKKSHPSSIFGDAPFTAAPAAVVPTPTPPPPPPPAPRLQKKQFIAPDATTTNQPKQAESKGDKKVFVLPASSFVEVKLLSGAYATESEAMPVAAIVERAFVGPNKSSVPLKGCQILGKAKGRVGFEIADVQATRLVCVWPDGSVLDEKINGWFASKPGVLGVPGKVITQSGKFLSTVGVTSFLEGVAQGLSKAQETTSLASSPYGVGAATNVSGNITNYGFYKGAEEFAGSSKQFFAKQAEKLEPAVLIEPGSKVFVFMVDSVSLKGGNFEKPYTYFDSVNLSSSK